MSTTSHVLNKPEMCILIQIEPKSTTNWSKLMEIWQKLDSAPLCGAQAKVNGNGWKSSVILCWLVCFLKHGSKSFFNKTVQTYRKMKYFCKSAFVEENFWEGNSMWSCISEENFLWGILMEVHHWKDIPESEIYILQNCIICSHWPELNYIEQHRFGQHREPVINCVTFWM